MKILRIIIRVVFWGNVVASVVNLGVVILVLIWGSWGNINFVNVGLIFTSAFVAFFLHKEYTCPRGRQSL